MTQKCRHSLHTTSTSARDVMSQKATQRMIWPGRGGSCKCIFVTVTPNTCIVSYEHESYQTDSKYANFMVHIFAYFPILSINAYLAYLSAYFPLFRKISFEKCKVLVSCLLFQIVTVAGLGWRGFFFLLIVIFHFFAPSCHTFPTEMLSFCHI